MSENSNLERVRRRIAALRAKAVDAACSESEAMACAEMAQRLMEEYGVTAAEAQRAKPSDMGSAAFTAMPRSRAALVAMKTAVAISKFTHTKAWVEEANNGLFRDFKFIGFASDVALAEWMLDVIVRTADYEADQFKARHRAGVKQVNDFVYAFCYRICARLEEMRRNREKVAATGTALVVAKDSAVAAHAKATLGWVPGGGKKSAGRQFTSATAYNEGRAAGDRANLNMAVGGRGERGRLN